MSPTQRSLLAANLATLFDRGTRASKGNFKTDRDRGVLEDFVNGVSENEIAEKLQISDMAVGDVLIRIKQGLKEKVDITMLVKAVCDARDVVALVVS